MSQFHFSENHQKPKQQKVAISHDPAAVFKFVSGDKQTQNFISEIKYSPYSKKKRKTYQLLEYLKEETKTTAFIVIRKDTILFEKYFQSYDENSLLPSWSISKSFVGALTGIANQEGHLAKSDLLTNYIPELLEFDDYWSEVTIQHLLNMRSGIDFNEDNYANPFSDISDLYISKNILSLLPNIEFRYRPGTHHSYSSLDTQLLALGLERSTNKSLARYLEQKLWIPLGMESHATWTVDSHDAKNTKGFCCLDATLRDYAKFARLFLKHGKWDDEQIIDSTWIQECTQPDFSNDCYQNHWYSQKSYLYHQDTSGNYKMTTFPDSISAESKIKRNNYQQPMKHWNNSGQWIIQNCGPEFYALGIFGQELFVDPKNDLIFIRLGQKWDAVYYNIFSTIKRELKNYE